MVINRRNISSINQVVTCEFMCVNEGAKCLNKQHIIFVCCTSKKCEYDTIDLAPLLYRSESDCCGRYLVFVVGLYSEDELGLIDFSTLFSAIPNNFGIFLFTTA